MFLENYRCDGCDFSGWARSGAFGEYIFDDGDRLVVSTRNAWCNRCSAISLVEDLPLLDVLAARLKRHQDGIITNADIEVANLVNSSLDEFIATEIKDLASKIRHFQDRKVPNRCIDCGLSDFVSLADEKGRSLEAIVHPECGGVLRRGATGIARSSFRFRLDHEGNRLPPEEDYSDEDRKLCGDLKRD